MFTHEAMTTWCLPDAIKDLLSMQKHLRCKKVRAKTYKWLKLTTTERFDISGAAKNEGILCISQ